MTNDGIVSRPALYYPYIHIRSEHWLKASLLCFPAVKRIVPDGYEPEDRSSVREYTGITGSAGPLLQSVRAYSPAADAAQRRLLHRLSSDVPALEPYRRKHSPSRDRYWIHDAKFSRSLLEFLSRHDLAWPSQHVRPYGHRTWLALHPQLGRAVMTVLGLSIARESGLDIVTDTGKYHEALLATAEDRVFDALLGYPQQRPSAAEDMRDIAELVVSLAGINLQALRPEHIAALHGSEAFRNFQYALRAAAVGIPGETDSESRRRDLKREAENIVSAWHDARRSFGREIGKVLFDQSLAAASREALSRHFEAATNLKVTAAVAVVMVAGRALPAAKAFLAGRRHLLSAMRRAQDKSLRLRFPLGLER